MNEAEDLQFADLINGFFRTYVMTALAELGVAAAIGEGRRTAAELAPGLGVDAASLHRLLRAAASIGLVDDGADGFALAPLGRRLVPGTPRSQLGRVLHVSRNLAPAFVQLAESVRTGRPPAGIKSGTEGFDELNDQPEAARVFNQSMVDSSRLIAARAAEVYDFARFAHIADLGGGHGGVVSTLLQRLPHARGTILDLAHARTGAESLLAADRVADRAAFVTGSFFDPIAVAADCYVLKWILHDWDDAHARRIVERVGEAARAHHATVVVIERVMPERVAVGPANANAMTSDLTMMLWSGAERTEAEYRALLAHGGLALTRIVPVESGQSVIEARPT